MRTWIPKDSQLRFVVLAWCVLLALLLRQLLSYGTEVPFNDDWIMLAELRPDVDFQANRLWWVHNEHRIPLPKLAWLATVGGFHDLRAGTFLSVLLVSGAALACIFTARKLRGQTHFADAFFPLVLMHGGQCENMLNSFQLVFALAASFTILGLVLIATSDERPSSGRIAALGAVALAMPLTGGSGLPHVAAWIGWFALVFWSSRGSPAAKERRAGRVALASAIAVVLLSVWYFVDLKFLPGFKAPSPGLFVATTLQFMARGLGEPVVTLRPLGSWIVLALTLWAIGLLVGCWFDSATRRARAVGIGVVIVAMLGTSVAVGYGRAMDGDGAGLLERYGLISAPLVCAFMAASALTWDWRLGRLLGIVLFALGAAAFIPNFLAGEREGTLRRDRARALEADFAAGLSIEEVARTRWRDFYYSPEGFTWVLNDLEALRLGPFKTSRLPPRPAPPFDVLRTAPRPGTALEDLVVRVSKSKRVLLVRDGAVLEFSALSSTRAIQGTFGIHAELLGLGLAPPARFTIERRFPDGTTRTLMDRTLDPKVLDAEHAEESFDLALDAVPADTTLSLRIEHLSEPKRPWAGYWRDVLIR